MKNIYRHRLIYIAVVMLVMAAFSACSRYDSNPEPISPDTEEVPTVTMVQVTPPAETATPEITEVTPSPPAEPEPVVETPAQEPVIPADDAGQVNSDPDLPAPYVRNYSPRNGDAYVWRQQIKIIFSQPMNPASVAGALRLSPDMDYSVKWSSDFSSLQISPIMSLEAWTDYAVTIDATARSASGVSLKEDFTYTFVLESP